MLTIQLSISQTYIEVNYIEFSYRYTAQYVKLVHFKFYIWREHKSMFFLLCATQFSYRCYRKDAFHGQSELFTLLGDDRTQMNWSRA